MTLHCQPQFEAAEQMLVRTLPFAWGLAQRALAIHESWRHGDIPEWTKWQDAWEIWRGQEHNSAFELSKDAPLVTGTAPENLEEVLARLKPWRKGPFDLFGHEIDAEWRCERKWNRIAPLVNWENRTVIDIGCGNGYYGLRMLGARAKWVLGVDPSSRSGAQANLLWYLFRQPNSWVLPFREDGIDGAKADIVVCMGVLYHHRDPLGLLDKLLQMQHKNGTLILETIVLPPLGSTGSEFTASDYDRSDTRLLTPENRYALMRNVWTIPTIPLLQSWLVRLGARSVQVTDITPTRPDEQRVTAWTGNESLENFLTEDGQYTVEGYPAPVRAILVVR